jgi:hypothetical protein
VVQGINGWYKVSLDPRRPELIGPPTAAELDKLRADFENFSVSPPSSGWDFFVGWRDYTTGWLQVGLEANGTYTIWQCDAAVGLPWDPSRYFNVTYTDPFVKRWIQFVYTSHPIANEAIPYVDPTWWRVNGTYQRNFEDGLPFYWTNFQLARMYDPGPPAKLRFLDRPSRGLADAPVWWEAHLYAVTEENVTYTVGDPPTEIWIYHVAIASKGIRWGFNITVRGPGSPGARGTYSLGGVAGDKFENATFNPPDYGYLVTEAPVGGISIPIDKFALLAPYLALATTIITATAATAIYVKRTRRRKKQ